MKRIRGGSGLGDALYLRPIVQHFIDAGERVQVLCNYADVFLGTGAIVSPFTRQNIDVLAHYVLGKEDPATTQWQDVCKSAGVSVPLHIEWKICNPQLLDRLRAKAEGRPIIMVHGGREPMGRTDGFGAELLPLPAAFDLALAALQQDCFLVRVGKGRELYGVRSHLDLCGQTTVADLLDIGSICDGIVAQCSFCVPLAEGFDKPLLALWAALGMDQKQHRAVKSITPQKILSKPTSSFVVDNWPAFKIEEAARAFRWI